MTSDAPFRLKIKDALQNNIDPLATNTYHTGLMNVATCLHATKKVNVDESGTIGLDKYMRAVHALTGCDKVSYLFWH